MMPIIERYLSLLETQMEFDASILTKTWVICTFVPFVLYIVMAGMKWYILLAPVTLPFTVFGRKFIPNKELIPWLGNKKN